MASDNGRNLVLAVNAGSSSLKLGLYAPTNSGVELVDLLLTASFDKLSSPPAIFSISPSGSLQSDFQPIKKRSVSDLTSHEAAFLCFLDSLKNHVHIDAQRIKYICHRVVHGGDYPGPVKISAESYHHIESLSDLAPLHNGRALTVIEACLRILPGADSIAFFDSMFHATIPDYVATYAINPAIANPKGLRKYGFHGLSYSFILRTVAAYLGKPPSETTIIAAHLGSGASVCAIRGGRSFDTSMGLTPLDGLPGATRAGHVDPSLIFHYTNDAARLSRDAAEAVEITDAEEILNKHAGWAALTGTTDFGIIAEHATSAPLPIPISPSTSPTFYNTSAKVESTSSHPHPAHALAFTLFTDRVIHYIGAYLLKLGGPSHVDALVFAGGIGEHSVQLRSAVLALCASATDHASPGGFTLDEHRNAHVDETPGTIVNIGAEGARGPRVLVCRTDEQLEMARQCVSESGSFPQ